MEVFGARASAVRQILNVADGLAVDSSPFSSNHTPSEDSELNTSDVFEGAPSQTKCNPPELSHRVQHDSSILALAVSEHLIYAGTQDGEILVWSLATYELVIRIQAHRRAVLCLFLSPDGSLLWSSGGDAIVNAWCPKNLKRLYHLYSTYDVGDCFSVAYSTQFETVYIGAQNTSIQWCNLKDSSSRPTPDGERHPEKRNHRFFDSVNASGGRSTPRPAPSALLSEDGDILEIDKAHMMHYAHFGYVYCMLLVRNVSRLVEADNDMLISGGGDGTIKLWRLNNDPDHGLEEIAQLGDDDAESVLSLAIDGSFLYSGKLEGCVELWDLDTKQRLRVIKAHRGDIMTLQMGWGFLWSAGSTGFARKYSTVQYGKYKSTAESVSQKYQCLKRWKSHDGKVLASACTRYGSQQLYITGANDSSVSIWNMNDCQITANGVKDEQEDMLIKSLRDFVAFKTVSSRPDHAEDCRKGATFLMRLFKRYGAYTEMLNTDNSHNPIVFARFNGNPATSRSRRRVLFYGHYDVVPADDRKGNWIVPPFEMKGVNGYVYGRGVSDNKGPILAALYGVLDCLDEKALDADVVFLIEGEEESGSRGFQDAVRRHKDLIGEIDYILLANSYWLTDDVPCLTYGLRGVLHATIRVDSSHPDVHSGVDGSYMMDEPLSDLTAVLAKLKGLHNRILIPGFYDNVLPLTEAEEARYGDITDTLLRRDPELGSAETLKASLMARWREPNLTIHRYKVSGPDGSLVSGQASATISLRLVPNQEVDEVIKSLMSFVETSFATLDTHNHLTVTIDNQADPWLGDPDNEIFQTLEEAIVKVWGPIGESRRGSTAGTKPSRKMTNGASPSVKPTPATTLTLTNGSDHTSLASSSQESEPDRTISEPRKGRRPLYIREGGSIPSIRFLEKEFRAPAAHLPCGQASDSAHLDNERLRLSNLYKSREIFKYVFKELSRK
ncbi:MAG: hypothetical protein M1818_006092 [Claussenomyces sp. TS43310]|nr:MAG: hypothetical protein M1818_006092 [Claussenomyces sp. TS43310]